MIIGATCVQPEIRTKAAKKVIDNLSEEQKEKFGINSDTEEDIHILNQLYFMFGGRGKEEPMFSYDEIDTPIIIGYRITCNSYDWVWFYKLNNVIKEVTNGEYKLVESKKTEDK